MREIGYARIEVLWVGPLVPYVRVGGTIGPVFFVYRKRHPAASGDEPRVPVGGAIVRTCRRSRSLPRRSMEERAGRATTTRPQRLSEPDSRPSRRHLGGRGPREVPRSSTMAKDLLRASSLELLPEDNAHVATDLKKVRRGERLSPVLLRTRLDRLRPAAHDRRRLPPGLRELSPRRERGHPVPARRDAAAGGGV